MCRILALIERNDREGLRVHLEFKIALRRAILSLRTDIAATRVLLAFRQIDGHLRKAYDPTQPRRRDGTSQSGWWAPRSARQLSAQSTTMFGILVKQIPVSAPDEIGCVYDFSSGLWLITVEKSFGCSRLIHQASVIPRAGGRGVRLNDN